MAAQFFVDHAEDGLTADVGPDDGDFAIPFKRRPLPTEVTLLVVHAHAEVHHGMVERAVGGVDIVATEIVQSAD